MKRLALVAAVTGFGVAGSSQPVQAGPLCDWLFGRNQPAVVPYAAGYPYQAAYPYAAGYPYVAGYPYAAGYPVAPATAYSSAYPGTTYPGTTIAPAPALIAPTVPATGAAALQMPAYSAAYPPVPATVPGDQGYAMFSPPPGSTFPVTPTPVTSFYGTGNVYPSTGAVAVPGTTYQAGYGSVAPVTAYQAPIVTNPSTVQTYPGIPAARPGLLGGMSRFFGNLFGTGYQSSYYRVPVTYYRPVTSLSPATGTTTVVQQPCTSYEYQLQRSPVTTFAPAVTPTAIPQAANCAPTTNYYNPYASSPYTNSAVAPAAAYDATPLSSYPATNPSTPYSGTTQPGQYYGPPATSPSTVTPASPNFYNGGTTNPDNVEIGQPQLQSSARPELAPYSAPPATPPATTWWSQSAMRNSMTESQALEKKNQLSAPALQPETTTSTPSRSDLRPLPAGEYPYQQQRIAPSVSEPAYSAPSTSRGSDPSQPFPSTRPADKQPFQPGSDDRSREDRVASADTFVSQQRAALANAGSNHELGYKPIQWQVRQAAYVTPSEQAEDYAPPVNRPASNSANRPQTALVAPLQQPAPASLPQASGQVQPSQRRSYSDYDSSGWTAKPRR